jgi:hypothetical protein
MSGISTGQPGFGKECLPACRPFPLGRSGLSLAFQLLFHPRMSSFSFSGRSLRAFVFCLALIALRPSVSGAEADVVRTNLVSRWITNLIDIYLPDNKFVNVYHTNWVVRYQTNLLDVFKTNTIVKTFTNRIVVDVFQTNWVTAYQTNWRTANLTNWTQVVATRTNQYTGMVAAPANLTADRPVPAQSASFRITAFKTERPPRNNLVEVVVKVTDEPAVQIEQWRIESIDGTTLCFGQDQEFKRELRVGKYRVEAKAKPEGNNEPQIVRGSLTVTERDAWIQYKPLASR